MEDDRSWLKVLDIIFLKFSLVAFIFLIGIKTKRPTPPEPSNNAWSSVLQVTNEFLFLITSEVSLFVGFRITLGVPCFILYFTPYSKKVHSYQTKSAPRSIGRGTFNTGIWQAFWYEATTTWPALLDTPNRLLA